MTDPRPAAPDPAPRRPVTLEDVAARARVSRATASRVLLRTGRYAERTRQHVERVADELGYVPNVLAAELASGPVQPVVGVVVRDASNPAYGLLLTRLQREAGERGLTVITMTVEPPPRSSLDRVHLDSVRRLIGMRVAGLVVATGSVATRDLAPYAERLPLLRVGRPEPERLIHAVSYDERRHGRLLADHLADLGHRRVVVCTTAARLSLPEHERATALADRLTRRGVEVLARPLTSMEPSAGVAAAADQARAERATAVACPSDVRALELLRLLRRRGLRPGPDLSVTGCDGIIPGLDLIGLTTVRLPVEAVAARAVAELARLIDGPVADPVRHDIAGELLPGTTTATATKELT